MKPPRMGYRRGSTSKRKPVKKQVGLVAFGEQVKQAAKKIKLPATWGKLNYGNQ
jgi:hypothetical protein